MVLNIKYCSYQLLRLIGVYVLNLDLLATYKLTQLFLIYIYIYHLGGLFT